MSAYFKGKRVTREEIAAAISQFDDVYSDSNTYENWLENDAYRFAVRHNGKLYPCKHILSMATGISTAEFHGGNETNKVFRKLGYEVILKP